MTDDYCDSMLVCHATVVGNFRMSMERTHIITGKAYLTEKLYVKSNTNGWARHSRRGNTMGMEFQEKVTRVPKYE